MTTSFAIRDPRIDPRHGDALGVGKVRWQHGTVRRVMLACAGMVEYQTNPPNRSFHVCSIEQWQKWAKKGTTVITRDRHD